MSESSQTRSAKTAQGVHLYDFRRPTTLAREHSRVLELAFDTFARQWGTQLTAKVRQVASVTCEQVYMVTYDDYASSLPATTSMVLCSISDVEARGVIQFPTSAGLSWLALMLGGTRPVNATDRTFTPVEQTLVQSLMDDALEDLKYSMGTLLTHTLRVDAIQYNSQFAQAAAMSELMIVARFTIRIGESVSDATVAIPATVLLSQMADPNAVVTAEDARDLLNGQVTLVPVDVSAAFAPAKVKPSVILGLRVGDVLPLPHPEHRPLNVSVGGQVLAQAAPGASGSRLAIVITNQEDPRS